MSQPLNIYISGIPSTGKTELVLALENFFHKTRTSLPPDPLPTIITEAIRDDFIKSTFTIHKDHVIPSPEYSCAIEKVLLLAQDRMENAALGNLDVPLPGITPGSWFITDRCCIDIIVYTLLFVTPRTIDEESASRDFISSLVYKQLEGRLLSHGLLVVLEPSPLSGDLEDEDIEDEEEEFEHMETSQTSDDRGDHPMLDEHEHYCHGDRGFEDDSQNMLRTVPAAETLVNENGTEEVQDTQIKDVQSDLGSSITTITTRVHKAGNLVSIADEGITRRMNSRDRMRYHRAYLDWLNKRGVRYLLVKNDVIDVQDRVRAVVEAWEESFQGTVPWQT
ncbi:hypothetical protein BDZ91DRAFT_716435 [Kalaharituber pfeilii]|nr:hypothetical protein BDZ91DRAFT_716435 [Kalaharituber pfeilii]